MTESIPALLLEIEHARSAFNLESSNFLAERLVQLDPSEDHLNILAESYLQSRRFSQVRQLLSSAHGKRSRYLLALACFKLDKLKEAEVALTSPKKSSVEEFLRGKDPEGKAFGKLGNDYFGGISMGLGSQKPMANYSDSFSIQREEGEANPGNSFFISQKKGGTSQYLYNLTKKGLKPFTDFFGKKQKKKSEEAKEKNEKSKSKREGIKELVRGKRNNERPDEQLVPNVDGSLRHRKDEEKSGRGQCDWRSRGPVPSGEDPPQVRK